MAEFPSPTPHIRAWREGTVGHVMLDRPERRADYAEGQRAFLEKRKPRFTGS